MLIEPERDRIDYGYYGKFWSARKHVMHVLADSKSERMRERALRFVEDAPCPDCRRQRAAARGARGDLRRPLDRRGQRAAVRRASSRCCGPSPTCPRRPTRSRCGSAPTWSPASRCCSTSGLGYLSLGRSSTTLSPGEAQRLRIATQLRSGLFGVVYVLDEPSAGLHPADAEPLLDVLDRLKASGNSLFVVEHDLDVVRRADWVVDIGPGAGEGGGRVLYSGPVAGLEEVAESVTGAYLFGRAERLEHELRAPQGWLRLRGVTRHNLRDVSVDIPLVRADRRHRGVRLGQVDPGRARCSPRTRTRARRRRSTGSVARRPAPDRPHAAVEPRDLHGHVRRGAQAVRRDRRGAGPRVRRRPLLVQRRRGTLRDLPGRGVRRGRAAVPARHLRAVPDLPRRALQRRDARGHLPRQEHRRGARPCPSTRPPTFLADVPAAARSLETLRDVGLGYLRLGQPATELSGGEAQRIKLATELQRARRGHALYLLDEPTAGLHPADIALLLRQLHRLVDAGNTVVLVEHDLDAIATADWVIDLGPGGGDAGGRVVATGTPAEVAAAEGSATAPYLARRLKRSGESDRLDATTRRRHQMMVMGVRRAERSDGGQRRPREVDWGH